MAKTTSTHFLNEYHNGPNEVCIINPSFRKVILSHLISNYSSQPFAPLYLGISGPTGEGKTFQTLHICQQHNIRVCYFSGAELSGNYERDSILDLENAYTMACNSYAQENVPCVIIIDDFHLSPASAKDGVGTTINSQLLTGFLMNLCDKAKSTLSIRTPIIFLANTFANIYEPLKRDGRMDHFFWEAPFEQKEEIIRGLFSSLLMRKHMEQLSNFIEKYRDKPIAFFSELRNDIQKEQIWKLLEKNAIQPLLKYVNQYENHIAKPDIDIEQLFFLAEKRLEFPSQTH